MADNIAKGIHLPFRLMIFSTKIRNNKKMEILFDA